MPRGLHREGTGTLARVAARPPTAHFDRPNSASLRPRPLRHAARPPIRSRDRKPCARRRRGAQLGMRQPPRMDHQPGARMPMPRATRVASVPGRQHRGLLHAGYLGLRDRRPSPPRRRPPPGPPRRGLPPTPGFCGDQPGRPPALVLEPMARPGRLEAPRPPPMPAPHALRSSGEAGVARDSTRATS